MGRKVALTSMTLTDQTDAKEHSLKRQLILRFLWVFSFTALLGIAATVAGYRYMANQAGSQNADNTSAHLTNHLKQMLHEWEDEASRLKAQIEFSRMVHGNDPKRFLKLRAFFTVQKGEVKSNDSIILLRRDGSLAFADGDENFELSAEHIRMLSADWYLSERRHVLYRVMRESIWLGDDGNGTLLLLRPVENTTLISLAPPNVELILWSNNQILASSHGSVGLMEQLQPHFSGPIHLGDKSIEQREILLDRSNPAMAHLIMQETINAPLSHAYLIINGLLLLGLTTLSLWLVLGRWLGSLTQRIVYLSQATRLFGNMPVMDTATRQLLDKALSHGDEISEVSASCRNMMVNVVEYQAEHTAYVQTLDLLEEGVVEVDRSGNFIHASSGWHKLATCMENGCSSLYQCIHPEDTDALSKQILAIFSGEKSQAKGRVRLQPVGEDDSWLEFSFVAGTLGAEGLSSVRGVVRDITQSYQLEKRITHMALHDALTGLPNRVLLEDRCSLSLSMAHRSGQKVAVGFIDVDHFKNVNDAFGHKTGDGLLIALANALKQSLRSEDSLSRWGGDEFIILLPGLNDIESVRQIAQKLLDTCAHAIRLDENEFNITFSMGFAIYPDDADNVDTLLSQSDRAMFHAKEQGRNNAQFFCDMTSKGLGKQDIYIQNRLSGAIKNRQIQAWFQPLVDAKTHRIIGVEALARWHDEESGWISPATFIPMAENLGLIRELGEQVWLETLRQGKRWREAGFSELKLAVNISRRQLFLPAFTETMLENLREFEIPSSSIILEITESVAVTDSEFTSKRLKELADAGFTLAIDDFGTGYSSLSQLHNMPIGKIKIDISFVRRVHEPQGAELIQAIIHMSEAFGLLSVAEGVEDENTAQVLREYGVHFLQGYFFGKPMPASEMDVYLAKTKSPFQDNAMTPTEHPYDFISKPAI
jgi:diguanylate cyclase (GGDEF)-like protein